MTELPVIGAFVQLVPHEWQNCYWSEIPDIHRQAFHQCCCLGSQEPNDQIAMQDIITAMQVAYQSTIARTNQMPTESLLIMVVPAVLSLTGFAAVGVWLARGRDKRRPLPYATVDPETGTLYCYLGPVGAKVKHTHNLRPEQVHMDVDPQGWIIGLELIFAPPGTPRGHRPPPASSGRHGAAIVDTAGAQTQPDA